MNIAYLILAHQNPVHLARLVKAIQSPHAHIFVHIDAKSDMASFQSLASQVQFTQQRHKVYWGDYSQVEAVLELLQSALAAPHAFDYFVLLSGSDYPVQPTSYIQQFLANHAGHEFMEIVEMPCEAVGKPLSRLTTYFRRPGEPWITRWKEKIGQVTGAVPKQRSWQPVFQTMKPYGGATWWTLSRPAVQYVMAFIASHPDLIAFMRNTVCPDETIFQTILGNSPFAERILPSLTYADWSEGKANPAAISQRHLALFSQPRVLPADGVLPRGEVLFARKFSDASGEVVSALDALLNRKEVVV